MNSVRFETVKIPQTFTTAYPDHVFHSVTYDAYPMWLKQFLSD